MAHPGRPDVDWLQVQADFEVGLSSVRALGLKYGVSHEAIRKRGRREGWKPMLRPAAAQATSIALQHTPNGSCGAQARPAPMVMAISALPPPEAAQAVQTAAATQVEVIRQHRRAIARDLNMCDGLMGYLQLAVQTNPPDTVLQVDGLAETFEKLVRCRERLVRMERVAFGLNGTEGSEREDGLKLTEEQQEALRAALVARVRHRLEQERTGVLPG